MVTNSLSLSFYSIWFLGQGIKWDIVLSPAPVAAFIYFSIQPMYILIDSMQRIQ